MKNYFGVEIDTKNMTLEELEEAYFAGKTANS